MPSLLESRPLWWRQHRTVEALAFFGPLYNQGIRGIIGRELLGDESATNAAPISTKHY
ncbi:hypothetical protein [Nocardia carnea]|uniref:hypothetical protein n=1 Tax=Nocardia carnea TaxID=37328 RepID=UPI0024557C98|nr:hypothetical protein [Nocardia carnea]